MLRYGLCLFFGVLMQTTLYAQITKKRVATLMGSKFDITVIADNDSLADHYIDTAIAEISRIENVISEWQQQTPVSEINRNAGIRPVRVTKELFDLTSHALYFSKISDGAFDISIAALDKVWRFDGSMTEMPSEMQIRNSIAHVGYRWIVLDSAQQTIFLKKKGMKIGFGSIGKGYAADKARTLLQSLGVKGGIINASGDLATWGHPSEGKYWKIGITNPFHPEKICTTLLLTDDAVTTSGSYEKFALIDSKRFSHIINPSTGYPATGLISVTVKGPNAEFANGLSTSVMVLGKEKGLQLMARFPQYSALLITDKGQQIKTKNFNRK